MGINANANSIVLNDNLVYLIELYNVFHNNSLEETLLHIDNRIDEYALSLTNQDGYLSLREEYNTHRNPLDLLKK